MMALSVPHTATSPNFLYLLLLAWQLISTFSWVPAVLQSSKYSNLGWRSRNRVPTPRIAHIPITLYDSAEVIDVDFERDETPTPDNTKKSEEDIIEDFLFDRRSKSLFDLSLEADPELNATAIPFVDNDSGGDSRYIDVRLAFMAELDGENYGIGIPFEHAAALTLEETTKDGGSSVSYLSPDKDDNEELMEIMAAQLKEHVGQDLQLKRTPRVLTISGPLEKYTKNWQKNLFPKPVGVDELLDESDEDLDFFHSFMKEELGEEEYEKTLTESPDDISPELLQLFDVPGLGDRENDTEGIQELVESMLQSPEEQVAELKKIGEDLEHDGVALKLISYNFRDGKAYSLVHLLRPYALVGKCVQEGDDEIRFELLRPDEERLLVPRLEEVCRKDLEEAGLRLL